MILARVIGNVVSTEKDPSFHARKILVCQPINPTGDTFQDQGPSLLAFDEVQAGVGDTVLIIREGNGCRQIWNNEQAPVNAVIAGIVDQVSLS